MVILAAVGEKHEPHRIIDQAYELATAYQDELQVLHVIPEDDASAHFEALRELPEFGDIGIDVEVDRAREVASKLVDAALESDDARAVTAVGRVGDPSEQILTLADRIDPLYVVIGGRKRSPTGKALFGSVTQSVILNAERPVVTLMEP